MSTLRLVSLPSELLNNWINNDNRAVIGSIVTDSDGSLIINDSSGQTYKTFKIPDSSLRDPSKYSLMISRAESPSKVSGTTAISGARKLQYYTTQEESPMQRTIKSCDRMRTQFTQKDTPCLRILLCNQYSYHPNQIGEQCAPKARPQSVSTSPFASASSSKIRISRKIASASKGPTMRDTHKKASEPSAMRRKSVPIASASSKSGPTMTRDTHKGQTWTAGPETRQGQTRAVRPERAVTGFCYR
jgi:hypothetical protein